ncbi:MAG TPA: hypothetical protein PKE04_13160, partial [Clostridia bacterium]|nr:hypothetical protein [Clostridia bacterium]
MKKFEMPVVVLNEMTMNESIASDCCFKLTTEGYVTTKAVLNGGKIDSLVTYPLKAVVQDYYGSRSALPSYHYKVVFPSTQASPTPTALTGTINEAGLTGSGTATVTKNVLFFSASANGT